MTHQPTCFLVLLPAFHVQKLFEQRVLALKLVLTDAQLHKLCCWSTAVLWLAEGKLVLQKTHNRKSSMAVKVQQPLKTLLQAEGFGQRS